ncbi:MAG: TrmH family RNA methyltransferase [Croceivirga sp.]
MTPQKTITSFQNPLVKEVLRLKDKSRERKKNKRFVIEGQRELKLAIKGNYTIEQVLVCEDVMEAISPQIGDADCILLSKKIYEKLAHRGSTEGVLAIAKTKEHHLEDLRLGKNPLVLVAEAPEKPGNIGALLRTADAANLDAVLIANPKSDLYNPNIIRSSIGCAFTTQVAMGTTNEILDYLNQKNIAIYCAALAASQPYIQTNFTQPSAIVVGTEATGLSDLWLKNSSQNIIIPMQGEIDSMNISVSAAILIFEAKRQRGF